MDLFTRPELTDDEKRLVEQYRASAERLAMTGDVRLIFVAIPVTRALVDGRDEAILRRVVQGAEDGLIRALSDANKGSSDD